MLLYRGFPIRRPLANPASVENPVPSRLEIGDTADLEIGAARNIVRPPSSIRIRVCAFMLFILVGLFWLPLHQAKRKAPDIISKAIQKSFDLASLANLMETSASTGVTLGGMQAAIQNGIFPDTRWSLILRLRDPQHAPTAEQALNELCLIYWQPLYAFLRRSGQDPEAAKDLVQGFLAHLVSNSGFTRVGPTDCRFRQFLLGALRNYLISEVRKQTAAKRGGGVNVLSLDVEQAEEIFQTQAADSLTPDAAFDRQWAQTVWTRALRRLRDEQLARGKIHLFEALKPCLTDEARQSHAAAARATGLSAAAVALAVHRMRRRLRELVIDELSQTVGAQADLNDELNYFLSIWSK